MEVDYSQYYYKPKRRKSKANFPRWGRLFLVLVIAGCFGLFIYLFSRTAPAYSVLKVNERTQCVEIYETSWFAVEMGAYASESAAGAAAQAVRQRGGAGYVYNDSGTFRVLAAAYRGREDAESVIAQLRGGGDECSLRELLIPSGKVRAEGGKALKALCAALQVYYDIAEGLERVAYDLDTNKTDLAGVKTRLAELEAKRGKAAEQLAALADKVPANREIQASLALVKEGLAEFSAAAATSQASLIAKYQTIRTVDSYLALLRKIV